MSFSKQLTPIEEIVKRDVEFSNELNEILSIPDNPQKIDKLKKALSVQAYSLANLKMEDIYSK